jgi:hypothetical protein
MASRVPYMVAVGNHEYVHQEPSTTNNGVDVSGVSGASFRPAWGDFRDDSYGECTVRVFRQKFPLEDAIGSHACSLDADMRVTNGISLGSSLLLPVHTVICVQTLKVQYLL